MIDPVSFSLTDDIGVITVDSPPVNAINQPIRAGLKRTFETAIDHADVSAILLTCAGRTFAAGADLREFDEPIADPGYHEVFGIMENSPKPVIVAMHGTALGAGLEAALACHYRCAADSARVGLPEVSLGIIPGAGGSQRLPRLVGAKAALELILNITPVDAVQALKIGILDHVIDGDFIEGATAYARTILAEGAGPRKTSEMRINTEGYTNEFLAEARKTAAKKARGQNAPELVIEAISHAIKLPFEEGIIEERRIGDEALVSEEARALRHIFFAEREIGNIPGLSKNTAKHPVESVAILGSGTMGGGIAMNFANIGVPVTLVDISEESLEKGLGVVQKNYENTVKRGRLSEDKMATRMALISGTTNYQDIEDKDLVIEAVFENMDLKKKIFAEIDSICKPDAILATNTSTLDVNEIARATRRPEKVVGLHFFSPANVMKLVEIVRGDRTSLEVLATSVDLAKRIRKTGVVAGVCFGFIGNRMMIEGFHREADQMLLEGATPEQIDRVMYEFGFPMGPWAMHDMAGVDIMHSILQDSGLKDANPAPYFNVLYQVAEMGRYGQKTGAGFYIYEEGNRKPIPDPSVIGIIENEAEKLGIKREPMTDAEIEERCLFGLINEGAKILEEGIAYRPGDIDVIWSFGYGFPRFRGGPMYIADQIGSKALLAKIRGLQERHGDYWKPASILEELAKNGKTFAEWSSAS